MSFRPSRNFPEFANGIELGMNHVFAMTVIGLNPVATRLSLRTRHLLRVPVNGKLGQIKRLCVPRLPSAVFWHWAKERNLLLPLSTGQHLCPQISRIDNMLIGEQSLRFQSGMNGLDRSSIVTGCCDCFQSDTPRNEPLRDAHHAGTG